MPRLFPGSVNEGKLRSRNRLEKNKIQVTIRREMGRDIDGACGQLRRSYIEKQRDTLQED